jgi:hypothetical protein
MYTYIYIYIYIYISDLGSDRGSGRFKVGKEGFEKINAQKIPVFMRSAFEGIEGGEGGKIMENGYQKDGFQKDYQSLTSKEQRYICIYIYIHIYSHYYYCNYFYYYYYYYYYHYYYYF